MLYIVWNSHNELGIPIIDEQHRGIVSTINSLHYFIRMGQGMQALEPTLAMLMQYTKIHFQVEQGLMEQAEYPWLQQHLLTHGALVNAMVERGWDASPGNDSAVLLQFLRDWWLGHINDEDRQYAPFVKRYLGL